MTKTFFFYDLETTGFNRFNDKIMQFAGQRYTLTLEPVGDPVNLLLKTPQDCIPSIDAILLTGITPQKTQIDGLTEVEFLEYFQEHIATPDTVFIGFNSIRFDDEFMRALLYRNYHDPYTWQYSEGRSRADVLDIVRMCRALRPGSIVWPISEEGKPSNRLAELTEKNGLEHTHAHDAMSDVDATVAVAKLIKSNAPRLFDYLIDMRKKSQVEAFLNEHTMFVYTSGRYPSDYLNTTIVTKISDIKQGKCYVYDLRHNPLDYKNLSDAELLDYLEDREKIFPIKTLKLGACPAIAPLSTLDGSAQDRIKLDVKQAKNNHDLLLAEEELINRMTTILSERIYKNAPQGIEKSQIEAAEAGLYQGFLSSRDSILRESFRLQEKSSRADIVFGDERLECLKLPYRARNYPTHLNDEEASSWREHIKKSLFSGENSKAAVFVQDLAAKRHATSSHEEEYILSELELWVESIYPE